MADVQPEPLTSSQWSFALAPVCSLSGSEPLGVGATAEPHWAPCLASDAPGPIPHCPH